MPSAVTQVVGREYLPAFGMAAQQCAVSQGGRWAKCQLDPIRWRPASHGGWLGAAVKQRSVPPRPETPHPSQQAGWGMVRHTRTLEVGPGARLVFPKRGARQDRVLRRRTEAHRPRMGCVCVPRRQRGEGEQATGDRGEGAGADAQRATPTCRHSFRGLPACRQGQGRHACHVCIKGLRCSATTGAACEKRRVQAPATSSGPKAPRHMHTPCQPAGFAPGKGGAGSLPGGMIKGGCRRQWGAPSLPLPATRRPTSNCAPDRSAPANCAAGTGGKACWLSALAGHGRRGRTVGMGL